MTTQQPTPIRPCECGCGQPAPIATKTRADRGHVKGQPMRFIRGHQCVRPLEAYYTVGNSPAGCWIWIGTADKGYGRVRTGRIQGRAPRIKAHRAMWERDNGPVPDGYTLDHLCRETACVNPLHLELVSHAVNTQRGVRTKLTPAQVIEIRSRHGVIPYEQISREFGIGKTHVWRVASGWSWRDLEDAA